MCIRNLGEGRKENWIDDVSRNAKNETNRNSEKKRLPGHTCDSERKFEMN